MQNAQVLVMNTKGTREQGRKAQLGNIQATKAVSEIVQSTLGPRSMLKMLIDPMGGIVMTNDGNAILREIDVQHPAAKSMIELSRVQDEEVGDGTTSVIILAAEVMQVAKPFIEKKIHPTVVVSGFYKALEDALKFLEEVSLTIDINDEKAVMKALQSCIGTKFAFRWGELISKLALDSTKCILRGGNTNKIGLEIKRYAKVEKIPGGTLEESCVLNGVVVNKDITHPKMRRLIRNPRILLLDSTLEYKKGESQTNMEMSKDNDMTDALAQEQEEIAFMCNEILKWNPDVVITEKGVSDLAQHFLLKGNVSVIRRIRKTDNVRIARVSGAKIVNRTDEIQESDIGTQCGLFEVKKIGDDYYAFFTECQNPTACSILLRGASKDVLNEMERNLHDCLGVAKNILVDGKLLHGGGAVEMAVSHRLYEKANSIEGVQQLAYKAIAAALEVIPRVLASNCGGDVVRLVTELRAKHNQKSEDSLKYGIDGNLGKIADMSTLNVWEPISVKRQVYKTAIESSCMLLRIDDVVSGYKKKEDRSNKGAVAEGAPEGGENETFGDQRDG